MRKYINARIYRQHDALSEILVEDGTIQQVGQNLPGADEEIDLKGRLVVPPYVDAHLHLDYVYTGRSAGAKNATGTLFEGIARWHDVKKSQTFEDAKARALRGIEEEVSKGVQFIRTHVDVDDPKLTGLKAMLELREELKDKVTIQIVAFRRRACTPTRAETRGWRRPSRWGRTASGHPALRVGARVRREIHPPHRRAGAQVRQADRRALR